VQAVGPETGMRSRVRRTCRPMTTAQPSASACFASSTTLGTCGPGMVMDHSAVLSNDGLVSHCACACCDHSWSAPGAGAQCDTSLSQEDQCLLSEDAQEGDVQHRKQCKTNYSEIATGATSVLHCCMKPAATR
jgi:hypothetical protein